MGGVVIIVRTAHIIGRTIAHTIVRIHTHIIHIGDTKQVVALNISQPTFLVGFLFNIYTFDRDVGLNIIFATSSI